MVLKSAENSWELTAFRVFHLFAVMSGNVFFSLIPPITNGLFLFPIPGLA